MVYADGSRETIESEYIEFQVTRPASVRGGPQAARGGKRIEAKNIQAGKIDRIERKKT